MGSIGSDVKISIWQQFSSNHSASFTVVGQFTSAEKAELAASELRQVLKSVRDWWQAAEPEEKARIMEEHRSNLTALPVEADLGKKYGVEWNYHLGWHFSDEDAVSTFENLVFVRDVERSWAGPEPLHEILSKMGADVKVACLMCPDLPDRVVLVNVICVAGTLEISIHLHKIFSEFFDELREIKAYSPTKDPIPQSGIWEFEDYLGNYGRYFEIDRHNLELKFYGLHFDPLDQGVVKFVDYLRTLNCTDIQYEFF